MATLGSLVVSLSADSTRFRKDLGKATSTAKRTARKIKSAFAGIGASIGAGLLVTDAVKQFADFDKKLVGVSKTTGIVGDELEGLGKSVQDLSRTLPVPTTQLLDIAQAAGQLGVTGSDNILKFAETVGQLGLASDLSGELAATSLARILTSSGTAVSEVDKLGSVIVRIGNNFAATESEIAAVSQRVANATSVFKLSIDEIVGIGGALKAVGVQAEAGGTVIGKSFRAISDSINGTEADFKRLQDITGQTADKLEKDFKDRPSKVFQAFIEGIDRAVKSGRTLGSVLKDFGLDGERSFAAIGTLATNSGVLADALAQAADEMQNTAALTNEAVAAAKSFSAQMQIVKNNTSEAQVAIGKLIAPAIIATMNGLGKAATALADNFDEVKEIAKTTAVALVSLVAAVKFGPAFNAAALAVTRFTVSIGAMNGVMVAAQIRTLALAGVVGVLRGALAFLGGPAGVLLLAAGAFLAFRDNADAAASSSEELAKSLNNIGKSAKDLRATEIQINISRAQERVQTLNAEIAAIGRRSGRNAGAGGASVVIEKTAEVEKLSAAILHAQQQLQILSKPKENPAVVAPPVVAPATGVAATPKFDALLKGLKDQNLHLGLVKDGFRDYVEQLKEVEAVAASVGRALTPTEKSEIQDEIINRQELGRVIRQNAADQSRANTHAASAAGIVTNSFKSAIIEGKKFKDVLKNLAAQLIEVALQKFILDRIQSSLFGFFGGFIPGFANGTHSAPGGLAVVGERGPELVNLPRGSQVTPNHRLGMGGDGGSNTTVQIINNSGAEASVERSNGPNGDELVKIFIGAAAENIASGGALSGAIQGSFGMHRQGAFG